jgi:hypothetical protein
LYRLPECVLTGRQMTRSRMYFARNGVIGRHYADHDFTAHAHHSWTPRSGFVQPGLCCPSQHFTTIGFLVVLRRYVQAFSDGLCCLHASGAFVSETSRAFRICTYSLDALIPISPNIQSGLTPVREPKKCQTGRKQPCSSKELHDGREH